MNVFYWLAGADNKILKKCSQGEKYKIAGFGVLVLIPAILGLFSMTYAISTITEYSFVYIPAGILWFFAVMFIDRFIISTMYKTDLPGNKANLTLATIARYVFAIFIGIAVSHPLVLLWFDGSTKELILKNHDSSIQQEEVRYREDINKLKVSNDLEDVNNRLNELEKEKICKQKLLTAEQAGDKLTLPCGSSSGMATYGRRAGEIKAQINSIKQDINLAKQERIKIEAEFNKQKDELKKQKDERIKNLKETASYDYLKRVEALAELQDGEHGSHILSVTWFMILFFIFVDIMPITMKVATPYGEYETLRDTSLFKVTNDEKVERKIIEEEEPYALKSARTEYIHKQKKEEMSYHIEYSLKLSETLEGHRKEFHKKQKLIHEDIDKIKKDKDQEENYMKLREGYATYALRTKMIFNEAMKQAQQRFLEYMRSHTSQDKNPQDKNSQRAGGKGDSKN